jgi:hypothetical protein
MVGYLTADYICPKYYLKSLRLLQLRVNKEEETLIHHQGIICGVAFDRSSLRRIAPYASVVPPRRLASNTLLVIRNIP